MHTWNNRKTFISCNTCKSHLSTLRDEQVQYILWLFLTPPICNKLFQNTWLELWGSVILICFLFFNSSFVIGSVSDCVRVCYRWLLPRWERKWFPRSSCWGHSVSRLWWWCSWSRRCTATGRTAGGRGTAQTAWADKQYRRLKSKLCGWKHNAGIWKNRDSLSHCSILLPNIQLISWLHEKIWKQFVYQMSSMLWQKLVTVMAPQLK